MKAVITVIGKDTVGILAKVSGKCAQFNVNVIDVSQTVLDSMFCMIMICDISKMSIDFGGFAEEMDLLGAEMGMKIHTMHEDIFESMHRI